MVRKSWSWLCQSAIHWANMLIVLGWILFLCRLWACVPHGHLNVMSSSYELLSFAMDMKFPWMARLLSIQRNQTLGSADSSLQTAVLSGHVHLWKEQNSHLSEHLLGFFFYAQQLGNFTYTHMSLHAASDMHAQWQREMLMPVHGSWMGWGLLINTKCSGSILPASFPPPSSYLASVVGSSCANNFHALFKSWL